MRISNSSGPDTRFGPMYLEFEAYDSLPPAVRQALAAMPVKISALTLKEKGWNEDDMLWSLNEYAKRFDQAPPPK